MSRAGEQHTTGHEMGVGWIGNWSPVIGDPTWGGWLTVALYAVAAWSCLQVLWIQRPRHGWNKSSEHHAWRMMVFMLLLLGINKQLDLQSALTEMGRMLAYGQGWYDNRRDIQLAFISVMGIMGTSILLAVLIMVWGTHPATLWAVAGCGLLTVFVLVRASSFHHVDALINAEWAGLRYNWVLEMGALVMIVASARKRVRVRSRSST